MHRQNPTYKAIDVPIESEILGVIKAFTTLANLKLERDSP